MKKAPSPSLRKLRIRRFKDKKTPKVGAFPTPPTKDAIQAELAQRPPEEASSEAPSIVTQLNEAIQTLGARVDRLTESRE